MADNGLKNRISGYIEELIDLEQKAGDPSTVRNLKRELPHIRQGLVRIMIIGQTSAGKSALINSLMSKIVVPENKAVSSPIPVWIGYHEEEQAEICIYNNLGEMEPVGEVSDGDDISKFIKNFCYRLDDRNSADGRNRERYDQVDYGSILIHSELLRDDITIIDTPGISASTIDNAKTIKALSDGVDFVIFLTKNNLLNRDEVDFLHRYIIGDCDDHTVTHPVPAKNIIFVHNNHGIFSPKTDVFINDPPVRGNTACGVKPFLKSIGSEKNGVAELSEEEVEQIVSENIIFINARDARIGKHGVYDYRKYAPNGCSDEELAGMKSLVLSEEKYSSKFDREELIARSRIEALEEVIRSKAGAAMNAVVNTRLSEMRDMLLAVREAANNNITAVNLRLSDIQERKTKFTQLKELDDRMIERIMEKFIDFQEEYTNAFRKFVDLYKESIRSECFGEAGYMPDDFDVGLGSLYKMAPEGRAAYIEPFISRYTEICIATCNRSVRKMLDEARGRSDDVKAPFEVLEAVEIYIKMQSDNLKNTIDSLKNNGADELGVPFPTLPNIKDIFDRLSDDLKATACSNIANQFNAYSERIREDIHDRVGQLPISFWKRLFHGSSPEYCWGVVRDEICQNVANDFFDHIVELAEKQTETKKAFGIASASVQKTHHEIFAAVNQSLYNLEIAIREGEEKKNLVVEESNQIIAMCDEIESKLDREIVMPERTQGDDTWQI